MNNTGNQDEWVPIDLAGINDQPREAVAEDEVRPANIVWYPTSFVPCFLIGPGVELDYTREGGPVAVFFYLFVYISDFSSGFVALTNKE